MWRIFALVVGIAACGGGTASSPTAVAPRPPASGGDPCVVSSGDIDAIDERCSAPYDRRALPSPDVLTVALVEEASVRSGATGSFTVELRNETAAPVVVPFPDTCGTWDALAQSATARSFESECGGLCGRGGPMARVTLAPGGVLRKRVTLPATRKRITSVGDSCPEEDLGPLPSGAYTLEVSLPWLHSTPIPGNDEAMSPRVLSVPLVVTP